MIARLLEHLPVEAERMAKKDSLVDSVLGGARVEDAVLAGMNPQHAIVSGGGAQAADRVGVPWNGRYVAASGNLMADFRFNVTAESQGRLQVSRLYALTSDPGVRDMTKASPAMIILVSRRHSETWPSECPACGSSAIRASLAPDHPRGVGGASG